jgi:hypothetical protein
VDSQVNTSVIRRLLAEVLGVRRVEKNRVCEMIVEAHTSNTNSGRFQDPEAGITNDDLISHAVFLYKQTGFQTRQGAISGSSPRMEITKEVHKCASITLRTRPTLPVICLQDVETRFSSCMTTTTQDFEQVIVLGNGCGGSKHTVNCQYSHG